MASERWHGAVRPVESALPAWGENSRSDTGALLRDSQMNGYWTVAEGTAMTLIRCRWHDAGVVGVLPHTPGKQAAAAFALYGLRLQAQGSSLGPVEARITITDRDGCYLGRLDVDAEDAQFMADAISGLLNLHYGPWASQDADRLRAAKRDRPPDRGPGRQPMITSEMPGRDAGQPALQRDCHPGRAVPVLAARSGPRWPPGPGAHRRGLARRGRRTGHRRQGAAGGARV